MSPCTEDQHQTWLGVSARRCHALMWGLEQAAQIFWVSSPNLLNVVTSKGLFSSGSASLTLWLDAISSCFLGLQLTSM